MGRCCPPNGPTCGSARSSGCSFCPHSGAGVTTTRFVMFGLGPIVAMIIGPRIATRAQRPRMRHSVLGTDLVLAAVIAALCLGIGWQDFLIVWAPPALMAGAVGIWLFYVQHQFEDA